MKMQDVCFPKSKKNEGFKKMRLRSLVQFCKLFKLIYSAVSTHTHCEVVFLFLLSARRKVNASES